MLAMNDNDFSVGHELPVLYLFEYCYLIQLAKRDEQ